MSITFGKVPHPGYLDIQHEMAGKPEGNGWNNLGQRQPKHVVLHRMWGTLAGTRSWFANPGVGALTDYGIGVASVDGAANAGVIHLYNNPRGYRSPWASGPVSAPYGDGAAFVNKFGINAVNRDCVTIEISGYDLNPLNDTDRRELVHLIAYWADQLRVPYTSLPRNPHTGLNFLIWHEEFTFGTGKKCPFTYIKQITNQLYEEVKAFLKPYQEGKAVAGPVQEPPKQQPVPKPKYAIPLPISQLTKIDVRDKDRVPAVVSDNGVQYIYVGDTVRCTRQTARYQRMANDGERWADVPRVGPDIAVGEEFEVTWLAIHPNGGRVYITPYWTRVQQGHVERIKD